MLVCSAESNSATPRTVVCFCPWNSPVKSTGMGSLSLLQGIFPTQGSNPGLPHCRQILYRLSHQGSPQWWPIHLPMEETEETWVQSLGGEDPFEEEMATHSSIPAWKIPEEPSMIPCMHGHTQTHTHTHVLKQKGSSEPVKPPKQKFPLPETSYLKLNAF